MTLCLIVWLALLVFAVIFADVKPSKPTARGWLVVRFAFSFLYAWSLSEFGSYALADYGVTIGYWQAWFGILAVSALHRTPSPSWREYRAAHERDGDE